MPEPVLLTPAGALATLTVDELASAIRPLWEDAPLLAAYLRGRRFDSWEALICEVEGRLSSAPDEWRAEVLRAHPRLGEDPEKLKARSLASWSEQGRGRSPGGQTPVRLAELNARYEARFGFPFVEWVAGRPLEEIVEVLERRLANDRSKELDKGSAALVAIARDRLHRLETGDPNAS